MIILLNIILIAVAICYLSLRKSYIELSLVLTTITILSIYSKQSIKSFCKSNIKLNKFPYIDFLPIILFITTIYLTLGDNYIYTSQDSLAFWGQYVRWIFINNALWGESSQLIYKHNIPGVPIYEYISTSIFGYSEKNIALSLHFLTCLFLSVVVKKITKNNFDFLVIAPVSFITLPLLGYAFVDIMVDGLLAAAITLYTVMFYSFLNNKEKFYKIIPISIFLVMIKPVSIWYLIFVPFFLFVWCSFFKNVKDKKLLILDAFYIILILAPALYIWYDWNNYVELIGEQREPKILYSQIFSSEFKIKLLKVLTGFNSWAINGKFLLVKIIELPYYITHILLNIITIIMLYKLFNLKNFTVSLILINFFVIFNLFTYLLLITFQFGDYEAENVASIGRYFGLIYVTWIIIFAVVCYYYLIKFSIFSKTKLITFLTIYISAILVLLFSQNHYLKMGPSKEAFKDFKNLKARVILNERTNKTKIYFISQGDFGHEASLFTYVLYPFSKSHGCWSFTNKFIKGKVMHWDCKGSIISRIGGFTHVYIHKLDDIFISEQKKYFKNNQVEEKSLYEIIDNNKKTLLILK